jgi:hypothetical protein
VINVKIAGSDPAESAALYHWLRADLNLARTAQVRAGQPAAGQLGAVEIINLVLTHVTGIASLGLAVAGWRRSRARPGPTTITRADGKSLTVDGPPEVVAETIERFLSED